MKPTLWEGDFVVAEKLSFLLSHPKVGQLVVVYHPQKNIPIVKRIINSKEEGGKEFYWVEGDNASLSSDSRTFGWIPHTLLLGRAKVIHRTFPSASDILF